MISIMNLQAIIITNLFGIALLVILLISSHLVRQRRQLSDKLFTGMIINTALACLIEMLTFLFDGQSQVQGVYVMNLLGNSFLYVANIIDCFSWCLYADLHLYHDENRIRKKSFKMGFPAIICLILKVFPLGSNPMVGAVFILIMAMPAASVTAGLCEMYHGNIDFAARIMFIQNVACIITIPVVCMMIG